MTKFSPESITLKAFKAFCFIFMLSLSSISVFAQSQSSLAPENQTEQSVSNQASSSTQSGATAQNWNWNSQGYEQNQKAPSTFGLFVKMVFMLAVVLALAYFVLRFLKKGTRIGSSDDPFLRHVSHLPLSASRSVDVVTILNHAYILG